MAEVLVVGSAVLDFVYSVDELPKTAQKFQAGALNVVGGGCAANASVAIARLGGRAQLLARFGQDEVRDLVTNDLREEGVDLSRLIVAQAGRSAVSSVYVDAKGERQIMAFRGEGLPTSPGDITDLRCAAILADTRWPEAARAAFEAAPAGCRTILDGEEPVPETLARLASHVVFSEQGLHAFAGSTDTEAALRNAAKLLPGWVAVTCGADGVKWVEDNEIKSLRGFNVEVVDTLGAGDVWHGAFALCLAETMSEMEAMRCANAAAALKCTGPGGRKATPNRAEVELFLKENT